MASEPVPAETRRHVVASAAELLPGQRKVISLGGREIGIFNVNGAFYALRNSCPHRNGPLCHGRLRPLVVFNGFYEVDHEREGEILKCPWHQWEFDLKTGQALYDEKLRVRTYPVVQEGEEIVLYL
jgi:3-phenylpropionate/trans-cinnamate dioxygenase ferredoxin subunit